MNFLHRLLVAISLSAISAAAGPYAEWAYSMKLYLNTASAGVTHDVRDFPLAVRLHGTGFDFSQALSGGADIRFAKSDGTALKYEIEMWDAAKTEAALWVKLDTVYGNSKSQIIVMYWGKQGVTSESNPGAVFGSGNGFQAAWHMGGSGNRANAVTGGHSAAPVNFEGDESIGPRGSVHGRCDSLQGQADKGTPDYLDIGDGYDDYSKGFTFSVWLNPTIVQTTSHFLDLGSGQEKDNILLQRNGNTNDLQLVVYNGSNNVGRAIAKGVLAQGQWQHYTATIQGKQARIYRNGALVADTTLSAAPSVVKRTSNFLGKSNWTYNDVYEGKMDEPWISNTVRSADWIKLTYANQRAGTSVTTNRGASPNCPVAFFVPADTALDEGTFLELEGQADCSDYFSWSASSPAPAILDPEVTTLQIGLPRVTKSTVLAYTFTAHFADSTRSKTVKVTVKEQFPDPVFSLPDTTLWNRSDSLVVKPKLGNLLSLEQSGAPDLNYAWSLTGLAADTTWLADGLLLKGEGGSALGLLTLCLDNGGAATCHSTHLKAAGVGVLPAARSARLHQGTWSDVLGRRGAEARPVRAFLRAKALEARR